MSNLLAAATSPYLLQHKDNPVHWHEWSHEAFALAHATNRPVFLSIGYSTCHWCHVMAHESFENPEVASVLNEYYVSIKVDREERPDIDRLYMAFIQATTGSGGWPLSAWLTPDGQPFFGGTYFPPTDRHGRPGFVTVLERIAEIWAHEPDRIRQQGAEVIAALRETASPPAAPGEVDASPLAAGLAAFTSSYDATHGGFGGGPKFPRPSVFNFLLRRPEPAARDMTLHTLRRMAAGGLRDHLGGGFHRYAVDGEWHVPHFEKMLYDQAQLVCSYVDAWQLTGDETFAAIARDTLDYVSRDLSHPAGGFFSAEDADSLLESGGTAHAEGAFYVWSHDEIHRLLDPDSATLVERIYGLEPGGNVDPDADPHHEFTGKNILIQRTTPTPGELPALKAALAVLLAARALRPRPHLDDKILTAWNGLMISAFARAGAALDEPAYLDAAGLAARFLRTELFDENTGELRRSWRNGTANIRAFAEDYAFLVQGLLDLYEAHLDPAWLAWARELQSKQEELFVDDATGACLGSAEGDPLVPLRLRDDYDGAEPSASAITALNLLRLGWLTHDDALVDRARRVIASFATILHRMPSAVPQMLCALDMLLTPPRQAVIAGPEPDAFLRALHRQYEPNRVILCAGHTPATANMPPIAGKAALYICENFTCKAPVTDLDEMPETPRLRASA